MVRSKEKVQISYGHLWPEPLNTVRPRGVRGAQHIRIFKAPGDLPSAALSPTAIGPALAPDGRAPTPHRAASARVPAPRDGSLPAPQ